VSEFVVILEEFGLPCSGTLANFAGVRPVCQILVVCPDDDGVEGVSEEVRPVSETAYDGEEFSIMDGVVVFRGGEGGREISNGL
jgi:hypothetical protein